MVSMKFNAYIFLFLAINKKGECVSHRLILRGKKFDVIGFLRSYLINSSSGKLSAIEND